MSDTGRAGVDQRTTEQPEDRASVERREFLKRGAITMAAGWLGLGGVRELMASPDADTWAGAAQPPVVARQRANEEKLERAIRQMERFVRKNPDGTFELKAKNAEEAGIDQEMFDQLRRSLEQGNEFMRESVKAGRLRANEVRATTGRPEDDDPGRSARPGGR